MSSNLITIPLELTIRILAGLNSKSLMRCAMTCKYIYDVVENSPILRLIIESHFTGFKVVGITPSTQSLPDDILKTLERRRHSWLHPRWEKSLSIRLDNSDMRSFYRSGTFCRQGGNFMDITPLRADSPFFSGRCPGQTIKRTVEREFKVREGHSWVDPSQDLIVLVGEDEIPISLTETRIICIHLCTLSTDGPHPRAMHPLLQLTVPPNRESNDIHRAHVQIARNVLMIKFATVAWPQRYGKEMRVVIWDWTTSNLILDSASPTISDPEENLRRVNSAIGLLDSTHIFTASAATNAIHLYKIVQPTPEDLSTIQYQAKLHLPETRSNIKTLDIYHQNAGFSEAEGDICSESGVRLVVNDDDRIHALTIKFYHWINDYESSLEFVNLYVHQRVFMQYFLLHDHLGGPALDVSWDEWGPHNTRIVLLSYSENEWSGNVHCQRAICPNLDFHHETLYSTTGLLILDFSLSSVLPVQGMKVPFSTISYPSVSLEKCLDWRRRLATLVPQVTIFRSEIYLFKHNVESCLPCVLVDVHVDESQPYDTYQIDAYGVVCTKTDPEKMCHVVDVYDV
ncbi:hypothetical protein BDN70DRAFT_998738 [Pholiota conissans]|uniref:F-box domain-containing protein n=1 Tax=Pholiota conissans TaxID=109636 RepID=A0A9P6CT05_9AGAR|nr:hypothetical protein BDN70DRAFT_998738 [Pholiota conissans]